MAPLVDHWHFTDLPAPRAASAEQIVERFRAIAVKGAAASTATHASPGDALAAAMNGADPADRIVVFGSFYTVGGVLENGLPQRTGRHAA
jgi:dihydrofolate synthase/folylpolyglutamate synthase